MTVASCCSLLGNDHGDGSKPVIENHIKLRYLGSETDRLAVI